MWPAVRVIIPVVLNISQLPVPDWGLRCPHCDMPLAGMPEHRCVHCGQPFSVSALLARKRPIPDLGLVCPECGYLLTGLTEERCPECGCPFSLRDILDEQSTLDFDDGPPVTEPADAHVRKRAPTFTGKERPLPQWGLECAACDHPLAGALADACPHCGEPFDLGRLPGSRDWVEVGEYLPAGMNVALAKGVLYQGQVPYLVVGSVRTGPLQSTGARYVRIPLVVPREFFFDALECLATAGMSTIGRSTGEWQCPDCEEQVPGNFETCWNCGAARLAI